MNKFSKKDGNSISLGTNCIKEKKAITTMLNKSESEASCEMLANEIERAIQESENKNVKIYEKINLGASKKVKFTTESGIIIEVKSISENAITTLKYFASTRVNSLTGNKNKSFAVLVLYSSDQIPIVNIGKTTISTNGKSEKKS